jgi:hypothetical protein
VSISFDFLPLPSFHYPEIISLNIISLCFK